MLIPLGVDHDDRPLVSRDTFIGDSARHRLAGSIRAKTPRCFGFYLWPDGRDADLPQVKCVPTRPALLLQVLQEGYRLRQHVHRGVQEVSRGTGVRVLMIRLITFRQAIWL